MMDIVIIDTNLLLLLVVGATNLEYISKHKLLNKYSSDDYELLTVMMADYNEILLIPHVLTELSNLARQIGNPAKAEIQETIGELICTTRELPIASSVGVARDEFIQFGLTDAVLLHLCSLEGLGLQCALLTVDVPLANQASALGYNVEFYRL